MLRERSGSVVVLTAEGKGPSCRSRLPVAARLGWPVRRARPCLCCCGRRRGSGFCVALHGKQTPLKELSEFSLEFFVICVKTKPAR